MGLGLTIALVLSLAVFYVLFHLIRKVMPLIMHGIAGIIIFLALDYLHVLSVPIDAVSFLIAAFGGAIGVLCVIALAYLGIPL